MSVVSNLARLKALITDHYGAKLTRTGLMARDVVWNAVLRCVHAYFKVTGQMIPRNA